MRDRGRQKGKDRSRTSIIRSAERDAGAMRGDAAVLIPRSGQAIGLDCG